jgi:hypothetical protein
MEASNYKISNTYPPAPTTERAFKAHIYPTFENTHLVYASGSVVILRDTKVSLHFISKIGFKELCYFR